MRQAQGSIFTSPNHALRGRSFHLHIRMPISHQSHGLGLPGFKRKAQEMERQHRAWWSQLKSWGTDLVTCLNSEISKISCTERGTNEARQQPLKALHTCGPGSLGSFLGNQLKLRYSLEAQQSIGYRLLKLSCLWIVLSADG